MHPCPTGFHERIKPLLSSARSAHGVPRTSPGSFASVCLDSRRFADRVVVARRCGSAHRLPSPRFAHTNAFLLACTLAIQAPAAIQSDRPDESYSESVGSLRSPVQDAVLDCVSGAADCDLDSRVHYDIDPAGALWARGASWKLRFDAAGATYFLLLGRRQPRHCPHALSPVRVELDGCAVDFERAAPAELDGDQVSIDRGAFVESYALAPHAVEQLSVFGEVPRGATCCGGWRPAATSRRASVPRGSSFAANRAASAIRGL